MRNEWMRVNLSEDVRERSESGWLVGVREKESMEKGREHGLDNFVFMSVLFFVHRTEA